GYEYTIPSGSLLGKSMRAETSALLERAIFGPKRSSWFDIFTAKDTFVDFTLSTYYGDVTKTNSTMGTWVPYGAASKRQEMLSHATFLSVANGTSGDTSTTFRGKNIREQLLCSPMAPVPDNLKAQVAAAPKEPTPGQCKLDFLNQTRLAPGTACI